MTKDGILRSASEIVSILGKSRLRNLGFNIPRGKLTARQAVLLNRVEVELPSTSDIAKANDIELQEIIKKHRESYPATRGRILQGFAHARTPRSGQAAQEH